MNFEPDAVQSEMAPPPKADMPVFEGAADLVKLLQVLCARPRRGESPDREGIELPRGRPGLPMVCVVRPAGTAVLAALATYLAGARPRRIPYALISDWPEPKPDADPVARVAEVLRQLAQRINRSANAGYGRLRFPLFGLAYWLLQQDVRDQVQDPDRALFVRLRERSLAARRFTDITQALAAEVTAGPLLPGWMTSILRVVPPLWFRARISGRVPLISRGYRWFLRQQHLAPHDPGTFVGFAERLTRGMRAEENPEEVSKLLVNAFLEDLRQAYRRRLWRPAAARRTTYPVVLLDRISPENSGYHLIRLINDVRNETGAYDPLLVVCGSETVPSPQNGEPVWPAARAGNGYQFWCQQLARDSRARKANAWNLPVMIPAPLAAPVAAPMTAAEHAYNNEHQSLLLVGRFTAAAAPFWSRRGPLTATTLLTMGCLVVTAMLAWLPATSPHDNCPSASLGGYTYLEAVSDDAAIGCIGYTDGNSAAPPAGGLFRGSPAELVQLTNQIFDQNRRVDQLVAERHRVAFTLVYLGQLTGIPADKSYGYASDIEELTGLWLAQARGLDDARTDPAPLTRIVVANAGYQMRHAKRAAELVTALKRRKPEVLAVAGLVESRPSTSQALQVFQNNGLLAVAPTLSADRMPENSHFYLQIAPPNQSQAELMAAYLRRRPGIHTVRLFYTTGGTRLADDNYVETLTADLITELGKLPSKVFDGERHDWAQQPAVLACGSDAVAVFAGRYSEFASFLNAVSRCSVPPEVIGNDSTSRFMASDGFRQAAPNLPLIYVAKGQLASCAALKANSSGARGQFLQLAQTKLHACTPTGNPLGEKVGLAYDAATLITDSVDNLLRKMADENGRPGSDLTPITSLAVHGDILDRYASPAASYPGITGALSFTPNGVPVDKPIHLVRVSRVNDPAEVPAAKYACGHGIRQSPSCTSISE